MSSNQALLQRIYSGHQAELKRQISSPSSFFEQGIEQTTIEHVDHLQPVLVRFTHHFKNKDRLVALYFAALQDQFVKRAVRTDTGPIAAGRH